MIRVRRSSSVILIDNLDKNLTFERVKRKNDRKTKTEREGEGEETGRKKRRTKER
jgi:hypothetical protein